MSVKLAGRHRGARRLRRRATPVGVQMIAIRSSQTTRSMSSRLSFRGRLRLCADDPASRLRRDRRKPEAARRVLGHHRAPRRDRQGPAPLPRSTETACPVLAALRSRPSRRNGCSARGLLPHRRRRLGAARVPNILAADDPRRQGDCPAGRKRPPLAAHADDGDAVEARLQRHDPLRRGHALARRTTSTATSCSSRRPASSCSVAGVVVGQMEKLPLGRPGGK